MKISKKLRNKILDAIESAAAEIMKTKCPSMANNSDPADWTDEDKERLSLIRATYNASISAAKAVMSDAA